MFGQPASRELIVADSFEEFWRVFPKRPGANPKKKAHDAYMRIVARREATPAELLEGARREARQREGRDPTFTAMCVTWLNQHRWRDEQWELVSSGESIFE